MEKAKELLKKYFGYENFRNSQIDIINSILKKQNTIGI
jgi:superfamily II DNA helicase RecQ